MDSQAALACFSTEEYLLEPQSQIKGKSRIQALLYSMLHVTLASL